MSSKIILSRLNTREIGQTLVYRTKVSSTMETALEQVRRDTPNGTVVVAGAQEHGKGRFDRVWISPKGGIYVSIILYPSKAALNSLTMLASLAVLDSIKEVSGTPACIKWPNDVLIGGKKVCGILAVSGESPSKGTYAVVGIGVNINIEPDAYPEIAETGTSLNAASGKTLLRIDLLCSLLENFERRYAKMAEGESQLAEWSEALITLGQQVTVKTTTQTFDGLAESVDTEGCLRLRLENGDLKIIPAGDVTLRTQSYFPGVLFP